ncbi:unnamed protein product [Linum trigynum]|uniref:Uncharacterized protein n=1 Tax=Linum trigynum TaxID=586398 RepID=A0AAV2G3F1_9ROSI
MIPPLPTLPLPPPMIPPLPSPPPLEPPVLFFPCLRRVPPPSRYSPLPTHATVLSLHSGSVGLPPASSHLQPHQMVSSDLSDSKSILLEPLQWLQLLSSNLNPTFILGIFVVYDLIQGFWASSSTSSPSASTGGSRTLWRPGYWWSSSSPLPKPATTTPSPTTTASPTFPSATTTPPPMRARESLSRGGRSRRCRRSRGRR